MKTTDRANEGTAQRGTALTDPLIARVLTSEDAQIVVDARWRIMLVNAATERLFGKLWSQLVGEPADSLVPGIATAVTDGGKAFPGVTIEGGSFAVHVTVELDDCTRTPIGVCVLTIRKS